MSIFGASSVWLAMAPAPAGGGQGQQGGGMLMLGYMAIIFLLFYFMMIRPQMKKEKLRKQMILAIKSGDRVVFSGGIIGTIANVKEQTFSIKIADGVKVEVARGAVIRALDKDENVGDVGESR